MTVAQAIDSIYEVFGIPNNAAAPEIMRRRIFNDLNSAMQLLWSKGHRFLDFYTRKEISVTISANTDNSALIDDIQSVIGPVRRASDNILLRPISSRGEFEAFHSIYAGSLTALANSAPQAYFIEALRPDSGADATSLKIYVVPKPTTNATLYMAVALKAPTFTINDYSASPSTSIPIPHNYAETLLLPIARYLASSSLFFADKSKQREPQLKSEYDRALQTLTEAA